MAVTLEKNLENANLKDKKEEGFSSIDLQEFTDLVKTEGDFKELIKGFEKPETIEAMKTAGIQDVVKNYVETSKKLTDLASIFDKEYKDLPTNTQLTDNQNLYEVCVLGALFTKGTVVNITTDYKKLAKEYYESIKITKVETKETKRNTSGTYETGSSDMKTTTVTEIETKTKIESGKKITEASVSISAGADQRKMTLEKAKEDWENKITTLKGCKDKFTGANNKTEIQKIIDEISKTNIESKITDARTDKKDNNEQHGNRYLIGARIAEGFIKAIDNLTLQPEPKLTLSIDRKNCSIGKINSDKEDDRFIHMNIDIKTEVTKKDEQQTNTQGQKKAGTSQIIEIGTGKKQQSNTGTGNQNDKKGGPRANDPDVIDIQNKGDKKTEVTGTGGTTEGEKKTEVTGTGKTVEGGKQENKTGPEVKEYMESKEITMLKNDVADHFMLKGENLVNGDVSDVEQDNANPKKYTATIKGYTQFIIEYKDKNIEISQGTVTKGLLKWNTNNPKTIIDRYTKDKKKENITITFDAEKSKTYINEKLNKATTGDQGKYEIKQASDVTEGQIIVYYKNTTILEKKADKDIDDKITIKLDAKDYTVKQDAVSNVATQRQKAEGTEKELRTTKDTYYIDNNTEKKLTYYAKTTGGSKTTDISIINNLRKIEGSNHISIFPAYDNIYRVKETAEKYAEKVQLVYETPNITSAEKQFKNTANIQWIKDSTYNIVTDFTIGNNTPANRLEIPITYTPGDSKNGNVSSIKNESAPKLSLKDDYNKVIDDRTLMIDGIVYDITFPISKAGNVPNIVFAHNTTKTLTATKNYTDKYKITSNIFTDTYENNIALLNHVNSGMGKLTYGPLIVKDNKREDPITYYKEAYVGQVTNKGIITNQGTKLTTIYFDQYGKYKNHELNPEFMTLPNQTPKADVMQHTPQIVKDPVGQAAKNINITSNRDGKENIAINMMNYREAYNADQKGEDFIKEKAPNLAKDMDNNFYTKEMLRTNIAKGRVAMFNGLKKISSHNISPESQKHFNLDPITEKSTDTDVIKGPDRKGIYTYELIKDHKSKNGKKEYPPQNIYSKVSTAGEIVLCNAKGESINEQNIYLQASDDYYTLKLSDNKKEFKIIGKKEEAQRQSPKVEIAIDKNMEAYKGDLQTERNCSYQAELSNNKFDYEFNNKYTSFAVEVERKDNEVTIGGKDKITDKGSFSLVDSKEENFGLYEDFFTTPDIKSLGIDEKTYEKVFKELFAKYETSTDKNLVKVKYLHKGKYYYAPMYLDISKRGDKNMFNLEMSEGRKKTNEEIERRLANMVKSRTINLEQDMTNKQKGENMLGWYLVKPNVETLTKYFENPSQEKIEFYLQTNNTVGGKFVAQKMNFMTKEEDIDEKKITIDNVEYKLSFKKVGKEYKIIIRKGEATTGEQNTTGTNGGTTGENIDPSDDGKKKKTIISNQDISDGSENITSPTGNNSTIETQNIGTLSNDPAPKENTVDKGTVLEKTADNMYIVSNKPVINVTIDEPGVIPYTNGIQIGESFYTGTFSTDSMGSAFFIEKNPTETNQTTETKIDEFIQEKITAVTPKKIQEITIPTNTSDIQKKSNSNVETNNTATTGNIEENTDTTSTTPTIANEKKIDTPAVTTFSIENPTLKKTISEYLPGAKTTGPKMKRVTFESVVNTVNAIQSKEARETIQELLSDGLVMIAQEYMGMKYQSRFSDNVASGRLDSNTINRMSKPRLLKKGAEVIPELSIDVQKSYRDLLATGEKNKKSYALISKKDCEIYVFSYDHRLLSKNNTLLGPVGDFPPSHEKGPTTPGGSENGSYTIDFIETKHAGFAAPSTYLQLKPDNRKYFDKGYSIGIHTYYQKTSTDTHRLDLLESGTHFRDTNGCINTSVSEAGPIYDNLDIGSRVVISQEPA